MKQIIRKILILLTALLFTGYAAYNGFVIIRDSRNGMSFEGKLISGAVAFAFALLAAYAFTVGLNVNSLSLFFSFILISLILPLFPGQSR